MLKLGSLRFSYYSKSDRKFNHYYISLSNNSCKVRLGHSSWLSMQQQQQALRTTSIGRILLRNNREEVSRTLHEIRISYVWRFAR